MVHEKVKGFVWASGYSSWFIDARTVENTIWFRICITNSGCAAFSFCRATLSIALPKTLMHLERTERIHSWKPDSDVYLLKPS